MDKTPLKEALEKAQLIVASHGMTNYMPKYSKSSLTNIVGDVDRLTFDFQLYPEKSSYDSNNFSCSLCIAYNYQRDEEREGGIYRDYAARVSIRLGSIDATLKTIAVRENMISTLTMLIEMIEAVIPPRITVTVMSPEDLKSKRQREHEQKIASQVFDTLGKDSVKNLRVNGKPKITRITEKYVEYYGSMPEPGRYRFNQIRYVNRRGVVKDQATFMFEVIKSYDGSSHMLKAWRLS